MNNSEWKLGNPANIYRLNVSNRTTRKTRVICSNLTVKTANNVTDFIVNFEQISSLFLVIFIDFEQENISWEWLEMK